MSVFNSDYPNPKRPANGFPSHQQDLHTLDRMPWSRICCQGDSLQPIPIFLGMYSLCISSLPTITVYPPNVNIYPFTNGRRLNNGNINC